MSPTRKRVQLSGGVVSYLEWPAVTPQGPDVLLLHGSGLDNATLSWGDLGSELGRAGHWVIAPDHPGYGDSATAPWSATQERLVDYVREFSEAVGLRDHVICGLSLGGGMTLGHLLRHPPRVRGGVLLGSYGLADRQFEGLFSRPVHWLTWLLQRSGVIGAIMRRSGRNRWLMEASLRVIIRDPRGLTPELVDAVMDEAARADAFVAYQQWQRGELLRNRFRTNYADELEEVQVPVLLIHGDRDIGVPVDSARRAAELLPDARLLVVSGAGHWVQRDRPAEVVPAVLQFLDEVA